MANGRRIYFTRMFEVDADIRIARTLPSDFYTDPFFFRSSKKKIFEKSWQFLGKASDVVGLTPVNILAGFLDEPVLIAKTDDSIHCLSNVCTHRGKILVEQPCEANLIRCGYHGRRFSLDGKFLSMPEFDDVAEFPSEDDDLKRIPFAARQGFMFASIDPVADFDDFVGDIAHRFFGEEYDRSKLHLRGRKEYEINAHWALYCENYLEGFHIPYVHKALNEVVDYGSYVTETFRYTSLQTGYDGAGNIAARYLFIFPNTMFNFYPWGISVNVVRPVSPSKCIVEFLTYVQDGSLVLGGAGDYLHVVELEDEAVVESVQKGIRSRFYSHGRYSPTREQGTHHFHRLITEFMNKE
jgi:choline monooxygenase